MVADLWLGICTSMQFTLLPLYMIDRGFSTAVAALTMTVYMLVAVAFRPVSGKLADSQGRYPVIIMGSAVFFLATGPFPFTLPVWLLLVMRGLQGLGFCFIGTALMTLVTDIIPKSRMSEGIGYFGVTQMIARAFPPLLALALKDAFGYPVTFTVVFVISALMMLSGFTLRWGKKKTRASDHDTGGVSGIDARSLSPSRSDKKEPVWEKLVDRDALKPSTIMLFIAFAGSCAQTFLVVHAISKGIGNPGVFFTANAIAIVVARLSVGKISRKFGSVAVLAPGMALVSLSMIGMYSCANMAILITSGVCYGLGHGMVTPELNTLCVLSARNERRGLANSTFFMAIDLGQAVGAYAMGVLAGYAGLGSIFLMGALFAAITLFGYLLLRRKGFVRSSDFREAI